MTEESIGSEEESLSSKESISSPWQNEINEKLVKLSTQVNKTKTQEETIRSQTSNILSSIQTHDETIQSMKHEIRQLSMKRDEWMMEQEHKMGALWSSLQNADAIFEQMLVQFKNQLMKEWDVPSFHGYGQECYNHDMEGERRDEVDERDCGVMLRTTNCNTNVNRSSSGSRNLPLSSFQQVSNRYLQEQQLLSRSGSNSDSSAGGLNSLKLDNSMENTFNPSNDSPIVRSSNNTTTIQPLEEGNGTDKVFGTDLCEAQVLEEGVQQRNRIQGAYNGTSFPTNNSSKKHPNNDNVIQLRRSSYSMMILSSSLTSFTWLYGLIIFAIQVILYCIIVEDQITSFEASTQLNLPSALTPQILTGQFVAILFLFIHQRDIFDSISGCCHCLTLQPTVHDSDRPRWYHWIIPNILKLLQGLLLFITSIIIILSSQNVIHMFKNYAALTLIMMMDEIAYSVALDGAIGSSVAMNAKSVNSTNFTRPSTRRNWSMKIQTILTTALILFLYFSWATRIQLQISGRFLHEEYPNCLYLDIDHPDYPTFASQIGDGVCDKKYNTVECGFDNGDCATFNLVTYPTCSASNPEDVLDDVCHLEYVTEECGFDIGSCCKDLFLNESLSFNSSFLGNGICDDGTPYNTPECQYDRGDCAIPDTTPYAPSFTPTKQNANIDRVSKPYYEPILQTSPSPTSSAYKDSTNTTSLYPTISPTYEPCAHSSSMIIYLDVLTNDYPEDISWNISDILLDSEAIAKVPFDGYTEKRKQYTHQYCISLPYSCLGFQFYYRKNGVSSLTPEYNFSVSEVPLATSITSENTTTTQVISNQQTDLHHYESIEFGDSCNQTKKVPTIEPTRVPTGEPTLSESSLGYCSDHHTFKFQINTGEMKDCSWLGEDRDRALDYCNEKVVGDSWKKRLKYYCRESCKEFLSKRCTDEIASFPSPV